MVRNLIVLTLLAVSSAWAQIEQCETFKAGKGTVISEYARIYGKYVELGRECFIDANATIGGGSAYDNTACLVAGDWLHMGMYSQTNIARPVIIGSEVGIGIGTKIFTHGAYLSEWEGFPVDFNGVEIGDRVWLPNAQVNPGVKIGNDVVITPGSVVTGVVPNGALAGGVPAKVISTNRYPRPLLTEEEREEWGQRFIRELLDEHDIVAKYWQGFIIYKKTVFSLDHRQIAGPVDIESEIIKNQLRRRGIRFKYEQDNGLIGRKIGQANLYQRSLRGHSAIRPIGTVVSALR